MASILSPYAQVRKSKLEKRNKHVEADQKQQVVDCGTKRAWKTDTSGTARCVPLYVTNTAYEVWQVQRSVYHAPLPVSSTNALDLFNSLSSSAFQAASLFFLRSSDMYAYFASQLNSTYYILNLWQSHHHHIFLEDHPKSCKSLAIRLRLLSAFNVPKLYRWLPSSSFHITKFVVSLVSTLRARLVPQSATFCLSVSGLLQHACFSFLLPFLTWAC